MVKVLVTNDDGIDVHGLTILVEALAQHADVYVVAPKEQQSGKSHSFQIREPFEVKQVELEPGLTVWSVDSTPADCVRIAVLGMEMQFDLVVSGHAHGGQWRLPGLINGIYAPHQGLFPSYAGGRYDLGTTTLIVSRGLARESTPVPRIFNRPELVIVEIH